jgi:hypothetical protein
VANNELKFRISVTIGGKEYFIAFTEVLSPEMLPVDQEHIWRTANYCSESLTQNLVDQGVIRRKKDE